METASEPVSERILASPSTSTRAGGRFHRPLLVVSAVCAIALTGLTALVYTTPFLAIDASIERVAQAINVGPLGPVLDFYREIGGRYGLVAEAVVFAIVLLLNRSSLRLLIAGALASGWYFLIVNIVVRPRPSVPDVLRVTEHPAASSYPSGHTLLFTFYAVILMTCLGLKFIPRRWQALGWAVAVLFVLIGGFSRVYSGAHWPTDVLGGALIAVGWLSFVLSIKWTDPVLEPRPRTGAEAGAFRRVMAEVRLKSAHAIEPGLRLQLPGFAFHPWLITVERFGLVVRGVLYALVGVFAVTAMMGAGKFVDLQGSLTLVEENALKVQIGVIAATGLIGYAFWGVVRAVADPLERGGTLHGIVSRVGFLWSAIAYTGLAVFSLQFAAGAAVGGGGLPFGLNRLIGPQLTPWVLPLFGVVVVVTGIGQFMDSWIAPFKNDFLPQRENPRWWSAWVWAGRVGLFARGIAFTVIGILMVVGGFNGELKYDYGLTRVFAVLLGLPAGAALLVVVALGFVALGLQSVTSPPVLRMRPGLNPPVHRPIPKET